MKKTANYRSPTVKVSELKINTSKIELEEGTSFQLNVIVLPNEATNKEVKWTSSDNNVATVTDKGLVKAIKAGNATITVKSIVGNKAISCQIIVKKKVVENNYIKLDDVSKEAKEMKLYDLSKLDREFHDLAYNSDETPNETYYDIEPDGGYIANDLWREEYRKHEEKVEQAKDARLKIFNKLIDNKKSFIVLIHTKECEEREYSVLEGAEKILKQNNYSYIEVGTSVYDGDETLEKCNLNIKDFNFGSVLIIKEGNIYKSIDPDVDSIKNDEETKNWLSKYIDIK